MPEMNGLEFVKAMRAEPRCASVPVVMVTTETHIDQMVTALEAGANEYIMKPFTAEMVEDKLRLLQVVK
jgi:two-component system chemotaxis response regulator CheY